MWFLFSRVINTKMESLHNDDEIIISESLRVLDIRGSGCIICAPDLSGIRYMAHRLEIRNITLGTFGWIPEWVLEVYLENCKILANTAQEGDKLSESIINLPQTVIQLTCRSCDIPDKVYVQLAHHRLIRLELINQDLVKLPDSISEYSPNLLFLNLNSNNLSQISNWPKKIRGLRLSGNKLYDLAYLGQLPPYLEDLDLSNNLFSEIPVVELPVFLRKLNMSQNELNWLPDNKDDYPPNLRELNISRNCGLNDLTDAMLPDMLTTLIAVECEISRLPHELDCYCLTNMDLSDNNITDLDELPFDKVMNINYVGNPCWVPSPLDSLTSSADSISNQDFQPGFIDDDKESLGANSVFTSGCPSPVKDSIMDEYKEAISKSEKELIKINDCNLGTNNKDKQDKSDLLPYLGNDPLIQAIDYVMTTGIRRVGSFMSIMSEILTPPDNINNMEHQQENIYALPSNQTNNLSGQTMNEMDLDYYYGGVFGAFD